MNIKNLIRTILPTLQIVAIGLETFDADDTGIDDKLAKQIRATHNALQSYLDSLPAESSPIARGLEQTKAFCQNVLVSIDAVANSTLPFEQKEAQIRRLVKSLSDDTQIYQAKNGNDAKILQISIKTANEKLNQFLGLPI